MKKHCLILCCLFLLYSSVLYSQNSKAIEHNSVNKTILIKDNENNLSIEIDYSNGCKITHVNIKGINTLSATGAYTGIKTADKCFSSNQPGEAIRVKNSNNGIEINGITMGNGLINETWSFIPEKDEIKWIIKREYTQDMKLEDQAFPVWHFSDRTTWKGGILDNGGMVWCKYFNENDTYGVHTAGVTFWNPQSGHAFRIAPEKEEGKQLASKYTLTPNGEFACTQYVTEDELKQRYDLDRFVHGKSDVFAPFAVSRSTIIQTLRLQYIDYNQTYSRGTLVGIDSIAVRELLNTTGRYGVVDNNIIGANGWITNWKCMHEPFFAQIGLAVNDPYYTANFSSTLDQERDYAQLSDGRILSRWHGTQGDEIAGTYDKNTGYYEAMWGYTIDSQTGYVINTTEQFNLNGNINWLQSHKTSCEKALDWLIKRDTNNNGLFEMMNSNTGEQKASDWIDIVWASFENAFVNAQMYEALKQWAACESILGDQQKADYYRLVAQRLKDAFNKPINEGGFWYPEKKQYIYWRDKDGSLHGDNLVTPVNFAAIAFGLCDDPERIAAILDQIETRITQENLFHWPLCFDSFKREEVHDNNWPFPKYENGDIFPTWGYMGIRAYVDYDKAIALKYIHKILEQYNKDGLSSQRYSRTTQEGLGTDILAGISTTITALYRDIYGIRPKWNRMGLEPNMTEVLNGTTFRYTLRDTVYHLNLSVGNYEISTNDFFVKSHEGFGATMQGGQLLFYPKNNDEMCLRIDSKQKPIGLEVKEWNNNKISWKTSSRGVCNYTLEGMRPEAKHNIYINQKAVTYKQEKNGTLTFSYDCKTDSEMNVLVISE